MSTSSFSVRLFRPETGGLPLTVSRVGMVVLTVGFLLGRVVDLQIALEVQAAIYLFGMVAMNLPHGGYEHFANLRRRAAAFQGRYILLYLTGISLFTALFFVSPIAGLALAIGVAMAKGGFGDVHVMDALYGTDHIRSRPQRWLAAAVRGGAVMVVPMVFWPETFYAFSDVMISIFEPGAMIAMSEFYSRVYLLGGLYALILVTHLAVGYWYSTGSGAFIADAAESLLLVAYFAAVPVVIAVGLYFPLWYSARQVARGMTVEEPPADPDVDDGVLSGLDSDDPNRVALVSWGVLIAGSVATFGLAAGLWLLSPQPLGGAGLLVGLVAFWSVFISIVALPHVVVGAWLDRQRGIWYVP